MTDAKRNKLINKAAVYIDKNKFPQATRCLRAAHTENGKFNAIIMYSFSIMYEKIGNHLKSIACLLQAAEYLDKPYTVINPKFVYHIYWHLAVQYSTIGSTELSLGFYDEAVKQCSPSQRISIMFSYIYTMVAGHVSPAQIMQGMKKINEWLPPVEALPNIDEDEIPKSFDDKIHIAYISPDFRGHVMYDFYYAIFKYYDKSRFHITCVYLNKTEDDCTKSLQEMVDDFRFCQKMSPLEIATMLKEMRIDIAVDLAGYTTNTGLFLFRYRLAPVQISGLGWMESTGLEETDYLITDKRIDPPEQSYITEKPLYLPTCFCYQQQKELPKSKKAPCMDNGYITFGSFNRVTKFTDPMLIAWREILNRVPDSKLLLKTIDFASDKTKFFIKNRLENIGIDTERVILELPSKDYMERYLDVDIALDTYPYCGGGTTCDALYMGVPVISMYGQRRSSKFGRSILTAAGLPELVADSPDKYVDLAINMANDWDLLDVLHKNLRAMLQKSTLMDGRGYAAALEKQYIKMVH